MDEKITEALQEAKRRLIQFNTMLKPGTLGRFKNDYAISLIDEVLPKTEIVIPKTYDPDRVYPKQ